MYIWKDIKDFPKDFKGNRVLLFHQGVADDPSYPGHPITVSNVDYVQCGNAQKFGYTKWTECPDDPI